MYKKVSTDMNFPVREKEIAALWKQNDVIRRSFKHREGKERRTSRKASRTWVCG